MSFSDMRVFLYNAMNLFISSHQYLFTLICNMTHTHTTSTLCWNVYMQNLSVIYQQFISLNFELLLINVGMKYVFYAIETIYVMFPWRWRQSTIRSNPNPMSTSPTVCIILIFEAICFLCLNIIYYATINYIYNQTRSESNKFY